MTCSWFFLSTLNYDARSNTANKYLIEVLLENDKTYTFRPTLAIIMFFIRKNFPCAVFVPPTPSQSPQAHKSKIWFRFLRKIIPKRYNMTWIWGLLSSASMGNRITTFGNNVVSLSWMVETSGFEYPLTQYHISEELNTQPYRWKTSKWLWFRKSRTWTSSKNYLATSQTVPFSTSSNGQTGNNIYDDKSQSHGAPQTVRDETAIVTVKWGVTRVVLGSVTSSA